MDKDTIILKLKSYFSQKQNISTVYLFGSVAKNKNRSSSDVDVAILFTGGMDSLQRFEAKLDIANDLEDLLAIKVDVVDLKSADVFFMHQIMLGKELIIDNDFHRRVDFEVKSRREFFDMQPFYDLYHSQALKRLEEM